MVDSAQQPSLSTAAQAEVSALDVTSILALPTVGNTAEALKNLDLKIESINDILRRLRARRNCLPPVSQLPAEVLSRIFAIVASNEKPEAPQELAVTRNHSRQELKVALADALLWADIPSITPEWTRESLIRTADKLFPLSLSIRYDREQAKRIPDVVAGPLMSSLPRIRQLVFEGSETTLKPFLVVLNTTRLPLQLECLEFHADDLDKAYNFTHCITNASRFIQATNPLLLRHLVIRNCILPRGDIDFPLLPRLGHFELSITSLLIRDPFDAWFGSWVMQALFKMPKLEYLKVQTPWYDFEDPQIMLPSQILYDDTRLLRHLQRVDVICADIDHFTALMTRMIRVIPPSASIRFEITLHHTEVVLFEAAVDAIMQWLKPFAGAPGTSIEPLRSISFRSGASEMHLRVDGWTMKNVAMMKSHAVRPKISLDLHGLGFLEQHFDYHSAIVEKLCQHLHVKDVSTLRLPNLFKRSDGYRRLYRSMNAVESLRLSKNPSLKLVKALIDPPPQPLASPLSLQLASDSKITVYLPKLSVLTLSQAQLDQRFGNSSGTLTFTEFIRAVLAERNLQLSTPLQKLNLVGCRIDGSDARAFQDDGLVSEVHIYGIDGRRL